MTWKTLAKAFIRIVFVTIGAPFLLMFAIIWFIGELGDWAFDGEWWTSHED